MQFFPNQKMFSKFFPDFLNLHKIWNTLKQTMNFRGFLFLKLKTAKIGVILMPKKPRVITLIDRQHVKGSETLHESPPQFFCHIFWWLWKEISSKNSLLVVSVILRLFVNILSPDNKYSLSVKTSFYGNGFGCNYLQIKKYFLIVFLHFRNLHKIWITLKKNMSLRSYFFLKLYTANSRVT